MNSQRDSGEPHTHTSQLMVFPLTLKRLEYFEYFSLPPSFYPSPLPPLPHVLVSHVLSPPSPSLTFAQDSSVFEVLAVVVADAPTPTLIKVVLRPPAFKVIVDDVSNAHPIESPGHSNGIYTDSEDGRSEIIILQYLSGITVVLIIIIYPIPTPQCAWMHWSNALYTCA